MASEPLYYLRRPLRGGLMGVWDGLMERMGLRKAQEVHSPGGPTDATTIMGERGKSIRSPNSVAALQSMYRQNAVWRAVVTAIVNEAYRRPLEVVEAYAAKCVSCGEESKEEEIGPACPSCGGQMEEADPTEKARLTALLDDVNPNHQTAADVWKGIASDLLIIDDGWQRYRLEYVQDPSGQVPAWKFLEMWRGDPWNFEWVATTDGRIGGRFLTCLAHREHFIPTGERTACPTCGGALYDVRILGHDRKYSTSEGQPTPYIEGEVFHSSHFSPSTLYGQSPGIALWHQLNTTLSQDEYLDQVFEMQRPLDGLVVVNTDNPETVDAKMLAIQERKRKNPNYVPFIAIKKTGQGEPVSFVKFDLPLHELQSLDHRKEMVRRILAMYGAPPLIMADIEDAGGLNVESQQREMWVDTIERLQRTMESRFYADFCRVVGVSGWTIRHPPLKEEDEGIALDNQLKRVQLAEAMKAAGYVVELVDGDAVEFKFSAGGEGALPGATFPANQTPEPEQGPPPGGGPIGSGGSPPGL